MFSLFAIGKHREKLAELEQNRLLNQAEIAAKQEIFKHEVIARIGIIPTLAIGASAGCVVALLSNNREIIEQLKTLPFEELIAASQIIREPVPSTEKNGVEFGSSNS